MAEFLNQPWAAKLIPLARAFIRFTPPSAAKENLWQRVVDPYLAWRDHHFVAGTVAGRLAGTTNDILQQYLYYFGHWEPQVTAFVKRRLKPGDGFVDVGANIGYFSLLAVRCVGPTGSVLSVEASPAVFDLLRANIARNRAAVRALHLAASDAPGRLALYSGDECNCGTATLAGPPGSTPQAVVEAAPIDDVMTREESTKARLVKVDVEGAEAAVVAGMKSLLNTGREDREFLVEIHPEMLARMNCTPEDVLRPFHQAGFHAYVMENDYDAAAYLRPARPRPLARLTESITQDTNVVFSRVEGEEL